jgi:branched-subunit amino acid ABC-type transport system permease component/methionine synthase II (cobalamin-independent)
VQEILLFILLGLGSGALIAGIALGVVLTYRGSGIINLATGGLAMLGGYAYWSLNTGQIASLPTGLALPLSLAFVVIVGAVIEVVVYRPLRNSAPLAKLVASLGVLLVLQAAMLLAFGITSQPEPSILPQNDIHLLGAVVPVDRFILTGMVIATAAALAAAYKWTRFGLATRAASENEVAAILSGLSPNRISMINTLIASLVVGGLGILAASITELDPETLPLLIIPALAAALLARFTSFGIACGAGIGIGVLYSLIQYISSQSWFPQSGGVALPGQDWEWHPPVTITGKIRALRQITLEEFAYARARAERTVKVTLPSPLVLYGAWSPELSTAAYADPWEMFADAAAIMREEAAALARLGCTYVQIDAPDPGTLVDPENRGLREGLGMPTERTLTEGVDIINSVGEVPGVTFGLHLCKGNYQSKWIATGGYDFTAEKIFSRMSNFDVFLLEYDDERSGSFEPLASVPDDKLVVLGLVSSKTSEIEPADILIARINEAARYVDLERLGLSTQCGFSPSPSARTSSPATPSSASWNWSGRSPARSGDRGTGRVARRCRGG